MKLIKLGLLCVTLLFLSGCKLLEPYTGDAAVVQLQAGEELVKSVHNIRVFDNVVEPELVEVEKGTMIGFFITNEGDADRFIVEGYGAEEKLLKGRTVYLSFKADKEGSFEFGEFKRPLGRLVVR